MASRLNLTFLFLSVILFGAVNARTITERSEPSDLVSDGINGGLRDPSFSLLRLLEAPESCEQTYGFMPCTNTVIGNMFLIFVYGYLMYTAATYLSAGSELLLEILGPGLIGGSISLFGCGRCFW